MLTFVTYEVLKHPEVLLKLRAEIDEVLGDRMVSLEDLPKMSYTLAVMRETLRLRPPASTRSVHPKEATTLGNGKYFVTLEDNILVNVTQVHRDPEVWGDDVCHL
jgi:cytochrome P450/NADPH-cytochrome P450 reductase